MGLYQEPPQFSKDETQNSIKDYHVALSRLDQERWDQVLDALELSCDFGTNNKLGLDGDDFETLSAY